MSANYGYAVAQVVSLVSFGDRSRPLEPAEGRCLVHVGCTEGSGRTRAFWMQTTGAAMLAVKRCSIARVRMPAHDGRSAHRLQCLAVRRNTGKRQLTFTCQSTGAHGFGGAWAEGYLSWPDHPVQDRIVRCL